MRVIHYKFVSITKKKLKLNVHLFRIDYSMTHVLTFSAISKAFTVLSFLFLASLVSLVLVSLPGAALVGAAAVGVWSDTLTL